MAKIISEILILRLKKRGSRKAENNAPVESVLKATATFETLIAPKNAIQCIPITTPIPKSIIKSLELTFKLIFLILSMKNKTIEATSTRNQTNGIASVLMSLPKTPVNPQRSTMN